MLTIKELSPQYVPDPNNDKETILRVRAVVEMDHDDFKRFLAAEVVGEGEDPDYDLITANDVQTAQVTMVTAMVEALEEE